MQLTYLRFCMYFGLRHVPADTSTVLLYTTFLARSLKPSSIPGYLNVVKLMHSELGFPDPLKNWELSMVRRGIQRTLGEPPKQKLAITPDVLRAMFACLDLTKSLPRAFWAASLVAFYAFLRKSSLLPKNSTRDEKYLCIRDVTFQPEKGLVVLTIRHSKTIQFGQRVLTIPVSVHSVRELCPVTALQDMRDHLPSDLPADSPLFGYVRENGTLDCLTYNTFVKSLKATLKKAGYDASVYSGHSFRRGGCTHAFRLGVPAACIKLRGDWRSNAYERYITIREDMNIAVARILTSTTV